MIELCKACEKNGHTHWWMAGTHNAAKYFIVYKSYWPPDIKIIILKKDCRRAYKEILRKPTGILKVIQV